MVFLAWDAVSVRLITITGLCMMFFTNICIAPIRLSAHISRSNGMNCSRFEVGRELKTFLQASPGFREYAFCQIVLLYHWVDHPQTQSEAKARPAILAEELPVDFFNGI
jgi:hypothetical protein